MPTAYFVANGVILRALDANGDPSPAAKLYVYEAGTATPLTVYQDSALTTPHASPIVADANGIFAPVYISGADVIKLDMTDSADAQLPGYPVDDITGTPVGGLTAAGVVFAPTATLAETDVQAALEALDTLTQALPAANVTVADAGGFFTGTDVEAALQETEAFTQGQHTIWIPAFAMVPTTTNGAVTGTEELATNDVMVSGLDFDAATDEHAQFPIQMPKSWDEGTLVFQALWKDAATAGTGDVVWGFRALAVGDDDAMDAAFGTAQTVTDTFIAADDLHVSPESAAVTPAGTPAAEDLIIVDVYRDADNGSDTYTQDARLIGVRIHYTTDANTDD